MEKLSQLIHSLNSREVSSLKKYFKLTSNADKNLRSKLFELVLTNKNLSQSEIASKFQKSLSEPSFIMLKRRLMRDILKILVWDEGAKSFASKYHEAKYKCRLMILESELLIIRGLIPLAEERLQKALRLSKEFELTNESFIVNDLLQTQVGLKQGLNSYKFYANNNMENINLIREKFIAQDYFRKLTMHNLFFTNKQLSYIDKSAEATKELKLLSEKSSSTEIKLWHLRSEFYYNHLINNYENARIAAENFLELVSTSRIVHSKDNVGGANMQLAFINIYLKDYKKSEEYAKEALKYFVKGSSNQINAYDFLFTSFLYQRKYGNALEIIESVKTLKSFKNNQFQVPKWNYYEANLMFLQKKFDDSLALLQKQSELISDKSGWRLGYKILEMMCITELGFYDWLDYRIETFRKLLSDVKKENIARPKLIFQVYKNFIKTGYNFNETTAQIKEQFALLKKGKDDFKWDPKGYEIIRFDEWWSSKLKKRERKI